MGKTRRNKRNQVLAIAGLVAGLGVFGVAYASVGVHHPPTEPQPPVRAPAPLPMAPPRPPAAPPEAGAAAPVSEDGFIESMLRNLPPEYRSPLLDDAGYREAQHDVEQTQRAYQEELDYLEEVEDDLDDARSHRFNVGITSESEFGGAEAKQEAWERAQDGVRRAKERLRETEGELNQARERNNEAQSRLRDYEEARRIAGEYGISTYDSATEGGAGGAAGEGALGGTGEGAPPGAGQEGGSPPGGR